MKKFNKGIGYLSVAAITITALLVTPSINFNIIMAFALVGLIIVNNFSD